MLRGALAAFLLASCVGAANGQSPAEKLRSMREVAQDSLQKERTAASTEIRKLRTEAKEALAGWLQRGNSSSSDPSSPGETSTGDFSQEEATLTAEAPGAQETVRPTDASPSENRSPQSEPEEEAASGRIGSEAARSAPDGSASEDGSATPETENTATGAEVAEAGREEKRNVSSAVPASRRQAAASYRSVLDRYAQRRDLPRTLLYAIADAESFFDSTAVSSAGAIGLMQVHPPTGGRLAWAAIHGRPQTPSKTHLTTPENNVRLATKLLQLLLRDYFGDVESKWSRQLLATASYNAGASRVAEGLAPSGTIEAAVELANRFAPRGVYERLRRTAPPETQTYVRRVFSRRTYYAPWRGEGEIVYGIPEHTSSE